MSPVNRWRRVAKSVAKDAANRARGAEIKDKGDSVQQMIRTSCDAYTATGDAYFVQVPPLARGVPGKMFYAKDRKEVDFMGHYAGVPISFDVKSWQKPTFSIREAPTENQQRMKDQRDALFRFLGKHDWCTQGRLARYAGFVLYNAKLEVCFWVPVQMIRDEGVSVRLFVPDKKNGPSFVAPHRPVASTLDIARGLPPIDFVPLILPHLFR